MEFLGEAMDVKQVAELIGCSAWTVRQKHVKAGLPCFRTGPSGRMIFYRNQVTASFGRMLGIRVRPVASNLFFYVSFWEARRWGEIKGYRHDGLTR